MLATRINYLIQASGRGTAIDNEHLQANTIILYNPKAGIDFLSYIVLADSMGKRSSPDIIATVLEIANGGMGKTRLLTKANLTSAQFKKYVDLLVAKKLLAELTDSDGRPAFKTTGLGLQYLQLYNSIKSVSYLKA